MDESAVCRLYSGASVFVTGGTGFLGKLLLEKLLRACPNVSNIYLLVRSKKGKTEDERFNELFEGDIFNSMKEACPDYLKKVKLITGDVGLPGLGISEEDRDELIKNISVVFHIAATVRFDEKIRTAVHINVRGTKHLLDLAKQMDLLKAFIHVSTAYANCAFKQIDEKFYPPPMSGDEIIQLVDLLQEDVLKDITPRLLGKWPNTYAYTKAIAENIVHEYGKGLPISVVRPAVVISTAREPFPGWINNVYGATGVVVGAGLGLLRTMHCDGAILAELVPADMVINMMLVSAWDVATQFRKDDIQEIPVLNYVSSTQNPISWSQYMKYNEVGTNYPSVKVMWYYCFQLNKHRIMHNICAVFLHLLPALIIDTAARVVGKEPILWNSYKKIHKFVDVISYFSTQRWTFTNNNVQALWKRTSSVDKQIFDYNIAALNWPMVFEACMQGLRVHLAQDSPDSLQAARKRYRRLKIAHYTLVYTLLLLLLAFVTWLIFVVMT